MLVLHHLNNPISGNIIIPPFSGIGNHWVLQKYPLSRASGDNIVRPKSTPFSKMGTRMRVLMRLSGGWGGGGGLDIRICTPNGNTHVAPYAFGVGWGLDTQIIVGKSS